MDLTPLDPADLVVMVGLVTLAAGTYGLGGPWWVAVVLGAVLVGLGVLMAARGGPRRGRRS